MDTECMRATNTERAWGRILLLLLCDYRNWRIHGGCVVCLCLASLLSISMKDNKEHFNSASYTLCFINLPSWCRNKTVLSSLKGFTLTRWSKSYSHSSDTSTTQDFNSYIMPLLCIFVTNRIALRLFNTLNIRIMKLFRSFIHTQRTSTQKAFMWGLP